MMAMIGRRLRNAFVIDLEVLAIFRLLLALIVIWGLLGRIEIGGYLFPKSLATPPLNDLNVQPTAADHQLYSSRESRSAWTPWHWSLLWLDQVVSQTHNTVLSVQSVQPVAELAGDPPTQTPPIPQPVFEAWHGPFERATSFLASRLWFDCVIGIGIASAILFGLGLFTKSANIVLWIVVVSIQHRLPLFNSGADSLERLFLFWMMFLPAGAMFSLDAWWFARQGFWRKRINQVQAQRFQTHLTSGQPLRGGYAISNWATCAILVQLVSIYEYSALAKLNDDWWNGSAVEQALQWSFITKPMAAQLLMYPALLRLVTWSVLTVELLSPVLVFCPGLFGWTRRWTICFLVLMHLGIATTLSIGTFSLICSAGWLLFFAWPLGPSGGWRRLWIDQRDQDREPPEQIASSSRPGATAVEWLVVFLMSLSVWWNLSQASVLKSWVKYPQPLFPVLCQLGLDPNFPMFGQVPLKNLGWVHRVDLASGESFDIRPSLPSPLSVPNQLSGWFEPHSVYLWRQLHVNLLYLEMQQPEFVHLVRERLRDLELHVWREQARAAGTIATHEIDSAYSQLLRVDQTTGDEEAWSTTEL
ncbi:MAG: HTTM domain-containing protein [Planctomycetaceae bacterium]|nr:HTTM domain-containing protein [Planctomycetaceae bacterium]